MVAILLTNNSENSLQLQSFSKGCESLAISSTSFFSLQLEYGDQKIILKYPQMDVASKWLFELIGNVQ